jgi:hypothetical protein
MMSKWLTQLRPRKPSFTSLSPHRSGALDNKAQLLALIDLVELLLRKRNLRRLN